MWIYKFIPLKIRNDIRRIIIETTDSSYVGEHIRHTEEEIKTLKSQIERLEAAHVLQSLQIKTQSDTIADLIQKNDSLNHIVEHNQDALLKQIHDLKLKLGFISHLQYRYTPSILPMGLNEIDFMHQFCDQQGLPRRLCTAISKNDLMFHYSLLYEQDYMHTIKAYLHVGYNGFQIIQRAVNTFLKKEKNELTILDFGSGHGRVSRFLALAYAPEQIWISDIKPDAVMFQKNHLGVNGFVSTASPMAFMQNQTFDLIFCGSLFTHLPERLYTQWLEALSSWLNPGGILVFSVHDISILGADPNQNGFYFHAANEDLLFPEIEGHLADNQQYGITYSGEFFIQKTVQQLRNMTLIAKWEKEYGGKQDVYILQPEE